jgi:hypothetical protein
MLTKDEKKYFIEIAREKLFHLSNEKCMMLNKPATYQKLKREHNDLESLAFKIASNTCSKRDEARALNMIKKVKNPEINLIQEV